MLGLLPSYLPLNLRAGKNKGNKNNNRFENQDLRSDSLPFEHTPHDLVIACFAVSQSRPFLPTKQHERGIEKS
jgi:hypothetical protein